MSGKNARKKDAKKQLEERKRKALESVQLPIMPKFEIKPVPQSWLERDRPYLVIGRIPRSSPPEYQESMIIWMKANLGGMLGYLATEEDIEAAKASFDTLDEAEVFIKKAAEYLECSVQTMKRGEWNVVPPYTTSGIIYAQEEMAQFMKYYAKQERKNEEAFRARAAELAPELKRIAAKKGTVTQEQLDAEDAARAKEREREIRLLGINVVSTPADDEIAAETERVMNLTPTGGNDGDDEDEPATKVTHWRDLVARSDDPLRTLTAEHNHTVALIGVRERQIASLQETIAELRKKAAEIEAEVEEHKSGLTTDDVAAGGPKQTIRRIIRSPTGQLFKVLLNGQAEPLADGEDESSFLYEQEDQPKPLDESATEAPLLRSGGNRMDRYRQNVAVAKAQPGPYDDVIVGPGGEMQQDRVSASFDIIKEHNARVIAERKAREAASMSTMAEK